MSACEITFNPSPTSFRSRRLLILQDTTMDGLKIGDRVARKNNGSIGTVRGFRRGEYTFAEYVDVRLDSIKVMVCLPIRDVIAPPPNNQQHKESK